MHCYRCLGSVRGEALSSYAACRPLNIAAHSFLLLLYTSSAFGRKIEARMVAARVPHPDDAVLPPDGSWAVSR